MNKIYFAGNMIVDSLKTVGSLPKKGMLTKILNEQSSVGGSACNTAIDLKVIDPNIDIKVFGRIGDDDKGRFILSVFKKYNLDTTNVLVDSTKSTSYTDVITEADGARTFFQYGGANDNLCVEDFNMNNIDCDIFHIGYLLLLNDLDCEDPIYGTKMAKLLSMVQEKGIKTSIDVVSDIGNRYKKVIIPSLKYCSYVIINEIEISNISGIEARSSNGDLLIENIKKSIDKLFSFGVKDTIIVHCPELAIIKRKEKDFTIVKSFKVNKEKVASTVGAGDAFLAGALYGLSHGYDDQMVLKIGHGSAINNLYSQSSIDGAKPIDEIIKIIRSEE